MTKRCTKCGEMKHISEYSLSQGRHRSRCKSCESESFRKWREANHEKVKEALSKWKKENVEKVRKHRNDSQKRCRKHASEYHYKWRKRKGQTETRKQMNRRFIREYGITLEQYEEILTIQGGKCAICGRSEPGKSESKQAFFCVDHCHETGKVRGVICRRCNIGIGHLMDSVDLLSKAIFYLMTENDYREQAE
jgi:predicted  nucleic acid-binding Zn-ribbon protein